MTKEKQDIKLEKVDDKTAYENLLVKYAELEGKIADIKAKMLTDEKPCKDCDNGCNWEK